MEDQEKELKKIQTRLNLLENRLSRLESVVKYESESSADSAEIIPVEAALPIIDDEEKDIESRIGRFGLAWMGNIVLLFGIIFLTANLMNLGHNILSALIGYLSAALIFSLAVYLHRINGHLSFIFKINAQILLYFITLRLHFFTSDPVIESRGISLVLLMLLIGLQVYLAISDKSQTFAVLSVIFTLGTAIVTGSTHLMLLLVMAAAAGSFYYYYRFKWEPLVIVTIILCYSTFLIWFLGNPVMGGMVSVVTQRAGVIYFFGTGAIFSAMLLFRNRDLSANDFLIGVTFVNGILFSILLIFITLGLYNAHYVGLFTVITLFCLAYSIFLYFKSDWNFASAFYALYGFMAMSIALYGYFGLPKVYYLLSIQSLVVVSMALWFRNRLIIIMNSILFLTILLIYLISSATINEVNFSFAFVSLLSARIINWKKSRLQIETDLIRNLYMIEGFFMVLFALYHAVPKQFITLSWTIAALLYFLIGFLLKNVKYRYLALGTMICAAFYLFIVDLAKIEILYRILALLFLSAISIGISMYYANRVKHSDN
jgi:hypothetical protein